MQFFPIWNVYIAGFALAFGSMIAEGIYKELQKNKNGDIELTILELAQQGNIGAIEEILNRVLESYNLSRVNVKHTDDCLQISLKYSYKAPSQQSLVLLLKDEIVKLDIQSVNKIKVSLQKSSSERFIDWKQCVWVRPVTVQCENCGAKNRITLSDNREAICGKCKHSLENSSVFSS